MHTKRLVFHKFLFQVISPAAMTWSGTDADQTTQMVNERGYLDQQRNAGDHVK